MDPRKQLPIAGAERMKTGLLSKEVLLAKFHEICPEIGQLGLHPVILGKGARY
jgi:hypothetical protein